MSSKEHLEVVMQGKRAIDEWRTKWPGAVFDLEHANLMGADLRCANLDGANLRRANLASAKMQQASLIGAVLREAVLDGANLDYADLTLADVMSASLKEATLYFATLAGTNLNRANLEAADLTLAYLNSSRLAGTRFTGTHFRGTTLANCDMSGCVGVRNSMHHSPSSIGLDTLVLTYRSAGNRLTQNVGVFFFTAGVSRVLLKSLPEILSKVRYYNCFVAHGEPDREFARRLVASLIDRGVSCWRYSLDGVSAKRGRGETILRRIGAEKMIVLCSAKSLVRERVLMELAWRVDEEPQLLLPVSLDDAWKEPWFPVKRGEHNLKPFLIENVRVSFHDEARYDQCLSSLLELLRRETNCLG